MGDYWKFYELGSEPLTEAKLVSAIESMKKEYLEQTKQRAERLRAWSSLKLDYEAMSPLEQTKVWLAMETIISSTLYDEVKEIIEKYRRDQ